MQQNILIRPTRSWSFPNWRELWEYRDLLGLLVRRDFIAKYKQTILGPLWFILQPLLMTLMFTVVFGNVAKIPTDGQPPLLFYLCGLLGWTYFSQCAGSISGTFTANAHIFGKVYFPRLVIPLSVLISNLFAFGIQAGTFLVFYTYYRMQGMASAWDESLFLLPLLLLQSAVLALGFGLCISSLTTRYRDLMHALGLVMQLWMYATPVIYPLSQIPQHWRWVALLNPMVPVVEGFKRILLGVGTVEPQGVVVSLALTLPIFAAGLLLFRHVERDFIDTV